MYEKEDNALINIMSAGRVESSWQLAAVRMYNVICLLFKKFNSYVNPLVLFMATTGYYTDILLS